MAHADLDLLFDHLIKLAQKLLQDQGGFLRIGAVVEADGQVRYVAAMDDKEHPGAQPLLNALTAEFRSMAASGAIRASGICFDVMVAPNSDAPKRDAIQCRLEHSNGEAIDVFSPYSKDLSGSFRYEEVYATKLEGSTFPSTPSM
jgi:hypothetical protein